MCVSLLRYNNTINAFICQGFLCVKMSFLWRCVVIATGVVKKVRSNVCLTQFYLL